MVGGGVVCVGVKGGFGIRVWGGLGMVVRGGLEGWVRVLEGRRGVKVGRKECGWMGKLEVKERKGGI